LLDQGARINGSGITILSTQQLLAPAFPAAFPRDLSRPKPEAPRLSVIVPTLQEVGNLDRLITEIAAALDGRFAYEIVVADGGSTDGTVALARMWGALRPVVLVECSGRNGLAGDVLEAAVRARGDVVVVMDADLSHSPGAIAALAEPVLGGSSDMVVGSRYVPGGEVPDWPIRRRLLSRLGGLLAMPFTDASDPMSGFFAVKRSRLLAVDPQAAGFKIGLEVLAQGGEALRVLEVPIRFTDRMQGTSKIGSTQMLAYLHRLAAMAGGSISAAGAGRFAAAGLAGMVVDFMVFQVLVSTGMAAAAAHVVSFGLAATTNFMLNGASHAATGSAGALAPQSRLLRFLVVSLLALALRGAVLAAGTDLFAMPPWTAIVFAIGAGSIVTYLGITFFVFPTIGGTMPSEARWRVAAIGVTAYVVVLRLLFIGLADVIPQEAYYWNYAQHLDIGYLDHPPMVAWLIWIGTAIFGDNSFGVRFPAWLAWFATAFFAMRLTRHLFGPSSAYVSLLLVAILPFTFGSGLLMTPDAPLTAAWAGALFCLERALIGERRIAWAGVGCAIGIGMLSKYTIALLVPAILLLLIVEPSMRKWLRRPEPYLAAMLALLIFSPVIAWNLQNGLASFAFQSTNRLDASFRFALPSLIANAAILLSPLGLYAALQAVTRHGRAAVDMRRASHDRRQSRFIAVLALVPLSVFVACSLLYTSKLNWTGPLWLAVIPAVSAGVIKAARTAARHRFGADRMLRQSTAFALVVYALALTYMAVGVPGIPYSSNLKGLPVAWSEFRQDIATIERTIDREDGVPVLIGLDTYYLASQLAFGNVQEAPSVGRGVLGESSLMYGYWHDPQAYRGRPALLVGFRRRDVERPELASHFERLEAPREWIVDKNGEPAGRFYYRIGYGLKPPTVKGS